MFVVLVLTNALAVKFLLRLRYHILTNELSGRKPQGDWTLFPPLFPPCVSSSSFHLVVVDPHSFLRSWCSTGFEFFSSGTEPFGQIFSVLPNLQKFEFRHAASKVQYSFWPVVFLHSFVRRCRFRIFFCFSLASCWVGTLFFP